MAAALFAGVLLVAGGALLLLSILEMLSSSSCSNESEMFARFCAGGFFLAGCLVLLMILSATAGSFFSAGLEAVAVVGAVFFAVVGAACFGLAGVGAAGCGFGVAAATCG